MENKKENNIDVTAAYNRAVKMFGEKTAKEIFYGTEEFTNEKIIQSIRWAVSHTYNNEDMKKSINKWLDRAYSLVIENEPTVDNKKAFDQLMGNRDWALELNDMIKNIFE